jgi:hypothetical protein
VLAANVAPPVEGREMMIRMRPLLSLMAGLPLLAVPGIHARAADPPQRISAAVVYGDDPCPRPEDPDEIVVCAHKPEAERYRIPKVLREKPAPISSQSWASRVATMEDVGRQTLPGSCSVNGSYGFTGCTAAMLQQWFAERRMQESAGTP